jgi:hypothetical protein
VGNAAFLIGVTGTAIPTQGLETNVCKNREEFYAQRRAVYFCVRSPDVMHYSTDGPSVAADWKRTNFLMVEKGSANGDLSDRFTGFSDRLWPIGVRTEETIDLTPTIKGIFIELDGDGIAFQAGQYMSVHIPGEDIPRKHVALAKGTNRTSNRCWTVLPKLTTLGKSTNRDNWHRLNQCGI